MTPIEWHEGRVRLLDQMRLPNDVVWLDLETPEAVVQAISNMRIRGAPALGVAAGYALALAAERAPGDDVAAVRDAVGAARVLIENSRPTGRNLFWATKRVANIAEGDYPHADALRAAVLQEALNVQREDIESCRRIGRLGAALVPDPGTVLTHCNAGALATGGYGTALGVIRSATAAGKRVAVYVNETRPLLQGARLTAWELMQEGIPVTVIPDGAAATCLREGKIDLVVVGADRIAANGDVANKIGTYPLAVLADRHGVPFYVAGPASTFDLGLPNGDAITIEERPRAEVTRVGDQATVPEGAAVFNPAFDVTPAELVTALITDHGVLRPPYGESIAAAIGYQQAASR
ncbi:methylthioribose-1-phosphate isomerase [candidate division KD3-62 bacterium DG_56]|uniref:Methylthioribose-1-phosphate isomerase n=1 Tax=candidate division KD3-62 bacterium DG_56 TaxID=1704032 RepID=A0A0S7XMH0_9BACT|nr:MAG: methylthioribose-1-phosphate isomerase [candidate division KD3-62 bacterium DG_56]